MDEQCDCGNPGVGFYRIFTNDGNPGYLELACDKCLKEAVRCGLSKVPNEEAYPAWLAQEVMWR